jgi:tape measure domain-containing protein
VPVLSNLIVRIGASTDDFDKKVNASLGKIKRFGATISEAGQALSIGFSAPVVAAGAAALNAAMQMETLEKGLAATMKSTTAAATELEKLKEVSKLPGLGLKEAVQGSIRLQTLGSTADESRRIMRELGNALAVVGGGKEDFSEVIRQLSQMAAVGKVTKENLDPIVERIPQIAAIIKDKFGAAALGDPAKTFERMGISAQQFIGVVVSELEKGGRAGGDLKTSMENLREEVFATAAEFGKSLVPIGKTVVKDVLTPMVERAKELATAFNNLTPETKSFVVEAAAAGVALSGAVLIIGTVIEKAALIGSALVKVIGVLGTLSTAVMAASGSFTTYLLAQSGIVAGSATAAGAIGLLAGALALTAMKAYEAGEAFFAMRAAEENLNKSNKIFSDATEKLLIQLRGKSAEVRELEKRYRSGAIGLDEFNKGLILAQRELHAQAPATAAAKTGLDATSAAFQSLTAATTAAAEAVQHYGRGVVQSYETEFNNAVLKERLSILQADYNTRLSDGVAALVKYGSAAGAAAAALKEFRILEAAPSLGGPETDVRKLPTPTIAGLPSEAVLTGSDTARAAKRNADMIRIMAGEVGKDWSKTQQAISRQVSTIVTDLSRGIADIIMGGAKIGETFERIGKQIASSLIRTVIEGGINQVVKALGGLLTKFGGLGKVVGGIFGGGGGGGAAVGGGGGGAAGVVGSVMGMASGGILGMVTGIGSLVSGIVGNFQMAGMNKTLDLIEKEVRYSQIHLLHLLEKNNEYLPKLKDIHDSMIRTEGRQMAMAGGNNVTINISATGDTRTLLDAITRELKQLGVIPA